MKSRKLYTTLEEIELYKELNKKYSVEAHMLTGHTPQKLYSSKLDKQLYMRNKKK